VIFPIAAASFRALRQSANFRAATSRQPPRSACAPSSVGPEAPPQRASVTEGPTAAVNKPATPMQLGHLEVAGGTQARLRAGRRGSIPGAIRHSSMTMHTYEVGCGRPMLDTPRPCDMLANCRKGPKFREVVRLPPPSREHRRVGTEETSSRPHRRSAGSRAGSPAMGLSDTIVWRFRDLRDSRGDRRRRPARSLRASRATRDRETRELRIRLELSVGRGFPLRDDTAWALQPMSSSKRSTWRWGLVNEETA
jgi:hypothetical protein